MFGVDCFRPVRQTQDPYIWFLLYHCGPGHATHSLSAPWFPPEGVVITELFFTFTFLLVSLLHWGKDKENPRPALHPGGRQQHKKE